jgi:hypothetical protein
MLELWVLEMTGVVGEAGVVVEMDFRVGVVAGMDFQVGIYRLMSLLVEKQLWLQCVHLRFVLLTVLRVQLGCRS